MSGGPLTAQELLARWHIAGGTDALKLLTLRRRCEAWGLRPLEGTRGLGALYFQADVVAAEAYAAGHAARRRRARV